MAGNQGHNAIVGRSGFQPVSLPTGQRASAPPPPATDERVDEDAPVGLAAFEPGEGHRPEPDRMYNRWYGANYDPALSTKEIAQRVRGTLKEMVAAGVIPAGWKTSCRYRSFAGGTAIDVTIIPDGPSQIMHNGIVHNTTGGWAEVEVPRYRPDRPLTDEEVAEYTASPWMTLRMRPGETHTVHRRDAMDPKVAAVHGLIDRVVKSYRFNGSDPMVDYSDVNFYGTVQVDRAEGVSWQEFYGRPLPEPTPIMETRAS